MKTHEQYFLEMSDKKKDKVLFAIANYLYRRGMEIGFFDNVEGIDEIESWLNLSADIRTWESLPRLKDTRSPQYILISRIASLLISAGKDRVFQAYNNANLRCITLLGNPLDESVNILYSLLDVEPTPFVMRKNPWNKRDVPLPSAENLALLKKHLPRTEANTETLTLWETSKTIDTSDVRALMRQMQDAVRAANATGRKDAKEITRVRDLLESLASTYAGG